MFWGVTLESGKRYSQVVDTSYHLSMAALEPKHGGEPVMVMLEHGKAEFLLCTLDQAQTRQVPLDLNFVEGEEVTFFLNGKGTVHLTGYVTDGLQDDDEDVESSSGDEEVSLPDEEEEEEEEDLGMGNAFASRRQIQPKKKAKLALVQALNGDDSEEEDPDFDVDQVEDATEDEDNDDNDDNEEDEEDSDDEEPRPAQLQKRPPLKRPAPMALGRSDKPAAEQTSPGPGDSISKKKRKKNKKARTDGATGDSDGLQSPTSGGPAGQGGKALPGGVVSTDVRVGSGPVARPGKSVHVYYTGRLANHQVFDSCRSGKAFCFRMGKNEVIKGWETGIQGMKVGGRRRLVIPPGQAYGSTRMGDIPPNSTLYFDVELKAVS